MKKVYYLCYFDTPDNKQQDRNFVLSAVTKSTYIANALVRAGNEVEIVSASGTKSNSFCKGGVKQLSENLSLRLFDAKPTDNVIKRVLARNFLKNSFVNICWTMLRKMMFCSSIIHYPIWI